MLQEGLYSLLAESDAVTAIVGAPADRKDHTSGIFPVQMPEATPLPALVISQIAGTGIVTMEGPSALRNSRLQFSCYGRSYGESKRLAEAVWSVLEGVEVTLPDGTEVDVATVLLESEGFEEAAFVYHTPLDIEFWFREPAAT
jgi:Protein of unknown function (DUF3168)